MADPLWVSPSKFIFCYCDRWQTKLSSLNLELREDFWLSVDFLFSSTGERESESSSRWVKHSKLVEALVCAKLRQDGVKPPFSDCFMAVQEHRVISFCMKLTGTLIPSCPLSVPVQSSTYLQPIKHQLTHEAADLRVSVNIHAQHTSVQMAQNKLSKGKCQYFNDNTWRESTKDN